jgi:hypothetical protein
MTPPRGASVSFRDRRAAQSGQLAWTVATVIARATFNDGEDMT